MVRPGLRSRSLRRVQVRTPGGRTVIHYSRRKPQKSICANCGRTLAGVPCERPSKMHNMPKTTKRPERPFGGVLCSPCMRRFVVSEVRGQQS